MAAIKIKVDYPDNYDPNPKRCLVYEGESLRYEMFFENGTITLWDYLLGERKSLSVYPLPFLFYSAFLPFSPAKKREFLNFLSQ